LEIDPEDFLNARRKFYEGAGDLALFFPLMELSCQRVNKIEGLHYLYNTGTGFN